MSNDLAMLDSGLPAYLKEIELDDITKSLMGGGVRDIKEAMGNQFGRVQKIAEERYSFPLFFNVDYHTRIAPLPRLVREGEPTRAPLVAGEHLFAQTSQSFGYLKARLASGELSLPEGSVGLSSFGQAARQAKPEG
jgi:hypothetical protein